jgi:molybdopterin biosynthesis enzyme MoaB
MRKQYLLTRAIRVGIIAVSASNDPLSNVGLAAWEASGGLQVQQSLPEDAFQVIRPLVIHAGKQNEVEKLLKDWSSAPNKNMRCDIIFTIGGDGVSPRDIVPDATKKVIHREIPGIADYLRQRFSSTKGHAPAIRPQSLVLSRATAGILGNTLIVNIPCYYTKPADAVKSLLSVLSESLASMEVDAFEPAPKNGA